MTRHTQEQLNQIAAVEASPPQLVALLKMQEMGWRVTSVQGLNSSRERAVSVYHDAGKASGWLLPCGRLSRDRKLDLKTMRPAVKARRGAGSC